MTEDIVRKVQFNDGENQTMCQQRLQTGNQRSEKQMNKGANKQRSKGAESRSLSKCVAGVRKIWATRKRESCDDIAKGWSGQWESCLLGSPSVSE